LLKYYSSSARIYFKKSTLDTIRKARSVRNIIVESYMRHSKYLSLTFLAFISSGIF